MSPEHPVFSGNRIDSMKKKNTSPVAWSTTKVGLPHDWPPIDGCTTTLSSQVSPPSVLRRMSSSRGPASQTSKRPSVATRMVSSGSTARPCT